MSRLGRRRFLQRVVRPRCVLVLVCTELGGPSDWKLLTLEVTWPVRFSLDILSLRVNPSSRSPLT